MATKSAFLTFLVMSVRAQQQTLYGQCGGINYSGPTKCATAPTYATCQSVNSWYYQCTPAPNPNTPATPEQTLYGQCGGINYSGPTACAGAPSQATCQSVNPYYYQCTPTAAATPPKTTITSTTITSKVQSTTTVTTTAPKSTTTTITTTTLSTTTTTGPPSSGKVSYAGVNIAGCDFGCDTSGNCNGVYCPTSVGPTQMQHFSRDDKLNIFRLPVGWQYLVNNNLGGPLDQSFLTTYDNLVQSCLSTGAKCIIDVHNYARWNGGVIGQGGATNDQFANLWSQLAKKYASQANVIFGVMNEPHDLSMSTWANTVQAVVTAIRNAGATSQWVLLPGTDYSSAQSFVSNSAPYLSGIKNPDGSTKGLIYDVHRYYDGDGSGQSTECVTDHVQDTFVPLATYLRQNNRQALLSETGGGNTQSCVTDVCAALSYLNQNNDVYLGWIGWAAGNFDQSYALSEVPNGNTDTLMVQQCIAGKFK